jgi:hypothetical protein
MKKEETQPIKADDERLTRTLPAFRVTESVYQHLLRRKVAEKRRHLTEVVRLELEDKISTGA